MTVQPKLQQVNKRDNNLNRIYNEQQIFHIWQAVLLLCLMMLTGQNALAQKMTVAGTVYDASGEALMGATVREAGTANGVATDMDGKFTLTCDQSSQLEISYVGYLTKR